jgi:hypothetical protein
MKMFPRCVRRPVSRVLSAQGCESMDEATIPLGPASRRASRGQPGERGGNAPAVGTLSGHPAGSPYSALLPVGFTLPPLSPGARCALTAPFHPFRQGSRRAGGLFSVALSLGSPPPVVDRHRISVEPGLSSSTGSLLHQRSPGRLTRGSGALVSQGSQSAPATSRGNARFAGCQPVRLLRGAGASASSSTASSRARVPESASPSTRSCRKRRWKAVSATCGRAGSTG